MHDRSDPNSLSNDRTNNLYEDPSGRIWFGAVNVINLWNPTSRTFTRYPNPAFPEANRAGVIGSDRKGRLWVSYSDGQLAMFDPSTGLFVNFDASDGVCGGVIDMENLDDGKVLLSGSGGLNIFDPDSVLNIHRAPPPLVITRMTINDSSVVPPTLVDGSGALPLSFEQNVIEMEFAALDIDAPQLVEYRYRLEGLEKEWAKPTGRRYVRYAGLRPGEYVFRRQGRIVTAANGLSRKSPRSEHRSAMVADALGICRIYDVVDWLHHDGISIANEATPPETACRNGALPIGTPCRVGQTEVPLLCQYFARIQNSAYVDTRTG